MSWNSMLKLVTIKCIKIATILLLLNSFDKTTSPSRSRSACWAMSSSFSGDKNGFSRQRSPKEPPGVKRTTLSFKNEAGREKKKRRGKVWDQRVQPKTVGRTGRTEKKLWTQIAKKPNCSSRICVDWQLDSSGFECQLPGWHRRWGGECWGWYRWSSGERATCPSYKTNHNLGLGEVCCRLKILSFFKL